MISVFLVALMLVSTSVEVDGELNIEDEPPENINQNKKAIKVLESREDFDTFVTNDINQIVVIGFFKDPVSKEAEEFRKAAESNDVDVQFGITSNDDLLKKVQDDHLVILIKGFDERVNKIEGEITAELQKNSDLI